MTMEAVDRVEAFIRLARQEPEIQSRLADCSIELWGEDHLPLDVDLEKVLAVASDFGFNISAADIIQRQCRRLAEFWQFEMGNAFVARRTLFHIQYQLKNGAAPTDYYNY